MLIYQKYINGLKICININLFVVVNLNILLLIYSGLGESSIQVQCVCFNIDDMFKIMHGYTCSVNI